MNMEKEIDGLVRLLWKRDYFVRADTKEKVYERALRDLSMITCWIGHDSRHHVNDYSLQNRIGTEVKIPNGANAYYAKEGRSFFMGKNSEGDNVYHRPVAIQFYRI
ncbi:hypothetical protein HY639_01720 [Candidatus Woesearchaeota archaeon]|nr:hypothetical protein [Candidatus Woesearchaeota archaeon]